MKITAEKVLDVVLGAFIVLGCCVFTALLGLLAVALSHTLP